MNAENTTLPLDRLALGLLLAGVVPGVFVGAALCLLGVAGIFMRGRPQDGALAITGAILYAAGLISLSIWKSGQ